MRKKETRIIVEVALAFAQPEIAISMELDRIDRSIVSIESKIKTKKTTTHIHNIYGNFANNRISD